MNFINKINYKRIVQITTYLGYIFSAALIFYFFYEKTAFYYVPFLIVLYIILRYFAYENTFYAFFISILRNIIGLLVIIHIYLFSGEIYVPALVMTAFSIPMIQKFNVDVSRKYIVYSYVLYFFILSMLFVFLIFVPERLYYLGNKYYELTYVSTYAILNLIVHVKERIFGIKDLPLSLQSKLFNLIFDNSYQFTGLLDKYGFVLKVNKTAMEFVGVNSKDVVGKHFMDTPWWDFSPEAQNQICQAIKLASEGKVYRERTFHKSASGKLHEVLFSLSPVKSISGRIEYLIAEGMDIAPLAEVEQKLVEKNRELLKIKNELEISHLRYKRLLDNSPVVIYRWDFSSRSYEYVSPAVNSILGYTPDEFYKNPKVLSENIDDSDFKKFIQLEKTILNEGRTEDFEFCFPDKSGNRHWFLHKSVLFFENNAVSKIEGILTDITELVKIRHEQEEIETRFKNMADNVNEGLSIIENEEVVYTNNKVRDIFGLSGTAIKTFDISNFIDIEDYRWIHDVMQNAHSTGKTIEELEFWIRRPDGERRYLHNRYTNVEHDGRSYRYVVTSDVTDRKLYEMKLRNLEAALENTAESVIITDEKMNIIYVNSSFEKLYGYSREFIINKNIDLLRSGHHGQDFYSHIEKIIHSGNIWEGRVVNKTANGHFITELTNISPIKSENDQITGFVIIKKNITEQLLKERQETQAKKMDALGTLAGGLAHDFNNILGGIVGSAELIKIISEGKDRSEDIDKYVGTIKSSSERASDLIKQLLLLSRREVSRFVTVDLNLSLKHINKICKKIFPKEIELDFKIESVPANVKASPAQIEQVLHNIAVNALHSMTIMRKDSNGNGGKFSVYIESSNNISDFYYNNPSLSNDTDYYIINMQDSGVGIKDSIIDKIFEPFYTTKNVDVGPGLGLAIVYNIIRQHDGFIKVDSKYGEGTNFKIILPAENSNLEHDDVIKNQLIKGNGKILLLDDNIDLLNITSDIIAKAGYNVVKYQDPFAAMEFYRENFNSIDILIVDLSIPGYSGIDFCKDALKLKNYQKILIISGYDETEETINLQNENIEFLNKPFNAADITGKIRDFIEIVPKSSNSYKA